MSMMCKTFFRRYTLWLFTLPVCLLIADGCITVARNTSMPNKVHFRVPQYDTLGAEKLSFSISDTLNYSTAEEDNEDLILNAVLSDASGEIVANGRIAPLTVSALHKNVAERNGQINFSFDIIVPESLLSADRQIKIVPQLAWETGHKILERVFVTGVDYRRSQDKGYEKYYKYFSTIIPDSVDFVKAFGYLGLLKNFTDRNIENKEFGEFGVTEPEAVEYYIKNYLIKWNNRRKARLEEVFKKCVKDPLERVAVRLDTVFTTGAGGMVYRYVQTMPTEPDMHRLNLTFKGSVNTWGRQLYTFVSPDTITYYVSSLAQMADTSGRYIEKTLARDIAVSTMAYIEFEKGSWTIDTSLANNAMELSRIRADFDSVALSKAFVADSVLICASCSPEGSLAFNSTLAQKRSESVKEYFSDYYTASAKKGVGFRTKYIPENWETLKKLIAKDSSVLYKEEVLAVFAEEDPDRREVLLSAHKDYKYIRTYLYPLLRKIDFTFYLHRRIYDTLLTKVAVDAAYMEGVKALLDRRYKQAIEILGPYADMNAAIAYLCLNYNVSALNILKQLEKTPVVEYLMALSYKRLGNRTKAAEHYQNAVYVEPRLRFRASLDPEMSDLTHDT